MVYKYKGLDRSGSKAQGRIEAPTLGDAKRRLQAQGILFEWVKESGESWWQKLQGIRRAPLPTKELSNFSRNLSIYLKSGVPLIKAINLLKTDVSHPKLGDFLIAIETMIEEGKSFYTAIETQKVVTLPGFYKQSLKVAEENGLLEMVLLELSHFLKKQEQMVKQVKKALTYPMFIMIISILMVGVMLTVVVPKITAMLEQMHKETPPLTQFVIDTGEFVSAHWLMILVVFTAFAYAFGWIKKHNRRFKYAYDTFMMKLPLFGRLIRTSELARFAYIASMLLRSGVPFVHTVKLSANILNALPIKDRMDEAATYVVEGKKFSQALVKAKFTIDQAFLQAIALGEETSELPQMLENLSELYNEENKDTTDTFLSLIEPVLILVVGLIMGIIVSAMLLPIFSLNLAS